MSWSANQQSRLLKVAQESPFSGFQSQLGKLIAALHKDSQKYEYFIDLLRLLISNNEFDKTLDIIGELDQLSNWKNRDQQMALAENIQSILNLFQNVDLDQNTKEYAFLDSVRLLGSALSGNANVKKMVTKNVSLLKFMINKMAELRHGDSQVEVLKQIFRLTPQTAEQKLAFCSKVGLDRSFQTLSAQDFNNTARKFLQGFNYSKKVSFVSFVQLNRIQGSLGQNNFKTICSSAVQGDFNIDGLSVPVVSSPHITDTLDLPYSDMMEWRHFSHDDLPGVLSIEIRMQQSWVDENKYLSIRFEVSDEVFAEIESLFEAHGINMWHGAVVRNPLSVKVKKPTLDESNVNERHKNDQWQTEATREISSSLEKYLDMQALNGLTEDKENIPPAKEGRKYKIQKLPDAPLTSSSPLMIPVPFELQKSPEILADDRVQATDSNQGSTLKRNFSIDSLPEPGQKARLSADSVLPSDENQAKRNLKQETTIPNPLQTSSNHPTPLKPASLAAILPNTNGRLKPKLVSSAGLSSGGVLADFAEQLLNSPRKYSKEVSKIRENDLFAVPQKKNSNYNSSLKDKKRSRQSSDTVPSRYESNDDSYVEEPEKASKTKRPARSKKKHEISQKPVPIKPSSKLSKKEKVSEKALSDVESASSQEFKKEVRRLTKRNSASDVEDSFHKDQTPKNSPSKKIRPSFKPWMQDALEAKPAKTKTIANTAGSLHHRTLPNIEKAGLLPPNSPKLSDSNVSSHQQLASSTKMGDLLKRNISRRDFSPLNSLLPKQQLLRHSLSLIEDSPTKIQTTPSLVPGYGSPVKLNLSFSEQSLESNMWNAKSGIEESPLGKISHKLGQLYQLHVQNTLNQVTQRLHQKKPVGLQTSFKKSIRKRIECTLAYQSKLKKIGDELARLAKTPPVY